jgi:hypothetical protein
LKYFRFGGGWSLRIGMMVPSPLVVDLHVQPNLHLDDDELIENLARFADGTLTEAAVKARHHLSKEDWCSARSGPGTPA